MINNLKDLINASKEFSEPVEKTDSQEKGRLAFVSKFPLNSIKDLNLEDYCIGTSENSFCYWLEFKGILFGIGGGNASKFGVYKSKDGNYYEGSGNKRGLIEGHALQEKFLKVKQEICQGLKFIESNEIEKITSIQASVWNMVLLKIFCIYFPDNFLTIGDPDVIIECARNIGITEVELKKENSILLNHLCRKRLSETSEFSHWGNGKIGRFVWEIFNKTAKRDYYIIGSKYGGSIEKNIFPAMLSRSVIATGFASKLDLTEFYNENHSVIKDFLQSHNEEANSIAALKHFLSLVPGDLVAIKGDGSPKGNDGYLSIIGIAEVIEKNGKVYQHDPDGLGHIVSVKFINAPFLKELNLGGYGRTIHKLSNNEHIKLIFKENFEMNYFEELVKFITQAESNELGTSNYLNNFQGLTVKVSFGKGNQAKIPWIAFLKNGQTVQEGIYPVYLYYKEKKLLILAYGVSETNHPLSNWGLSDKMKIKAYFSQNGLGVPDRYGDSYVYKVYKTDIPLNEKEIGVDLNNIIESYSQVLQPNNSNIERNDGKQEFEGHLFMESVRKSGLSFSNNICVRFIASLLSKPFVILTGLSGSGKTKLAQSFAAWITESKDQYCLVPVGADWTNREPLLGFPNALISGEYVKPDNKVLNLIIAANVHSNKPHFLILDEMNLSHVERYFADFLSVMESNGKIPLHTGLEKWGDVPPDIRLPENLFIIGTVNIDETTYMFSPKVLDRANVIEFRVTLEEMEEFLNNTINLDLVKLSTVGANMAENFVEIATNKSLISNGDVELKSTLLIFFDELKKAGAEFGYRSAAEIFRFAAVINVIEPTWSMTEIIDAAIMQKLLPKVHGSRRKLEPILKALGNICLQEGQKLDEILTSATAIDFSDSKSIKYPISLEKILRMFNGLKENGFTSYAEA